MNPSEQVFLEAIRHGLFVIDEQGRVWRHKIRTRSGRLRDVPPRRAEATITGGYLQLRLSVNRIVSRCQAHIIVWRQAHAPIPDGFELNHKDGVKSHNWLDNLELSTPSHNSQHAYDMGLKQPPVRPLNGLVKLSQNDAEEIREEYRMGKLQRHIATERGVTQATISRIVRGVAFPSGRDERFRMSE